MRAIYEICWVGVDLRRFRFKAPNGEVLLESEDYKTAAGCANGVASCRAHAPFDRFYVRDISGATPPAFLLRAANNRVIGQGPIYSSVQKRELEIQAIRQYAADADVYDHTK